MFYLIISLYYANLQSTGKCVRKYKNKINTVNICTRNILNLKAIKGYFYGKCQCRSEESSQWETERMEGLTIQKRQNSHKRIYFSLILDISITTTPKRHFSSFFIISSTISPPSPSKQYFGQRKISASAIQNNMAQSYVLLTSFFYSFILFVLSSKSVRC